MVEPGRVAVIHFTGRIAEGEAAGEVFDTTNVDVALEEGIYHDHRDYKPLHVRVGEGKILPGVDRALREMESGERRTVRLDPEEAFGERRDEHVADLPTDVLEADDRASIEPGEMVHADRGETGWILEVNEEDDRAVVDFNHELAGTAIEAELHVLEVQGGSAIDDAPDEAGDDAS